MALALTLFENDRVRVWSMTLGANGGIYDFHQHEQDHVIIWPDAGRAEAMQYGDEGRAISQVAQPGYVMLKTVGSGGPMVPRRIRNLEDHPVTHYIVELISEPSPSSVTLPTEANARIHHQPADVSTPRPGLTAKRTGPA